MIFPFFENYLERQRVVGDFARGARRNLSLSFRPRRAESPPSGEILRVCAFAGCCPSPFLAFPLFKGEGGPLAVDEGCYILI